MLFVKDDGKRYHYKDHFDFSDVRMVVHADTGITKHSISFLCQKNWIAQILTFSSLSEKQDIINTVRPFLKEQQKKHFLAMKKGEIKERKTSFDETGNTTEIVLGKNSSLSSLPFPFASSPNSNSGTSSSSVSGSNSPSSSSGGGLIKQRSLGNLARKKIHHLEPY